uniref:Uncharacterized protein n=1 Tax=Arundo donax TaxID=35708 RepID=A0A0A8XWY2_ARUDO
MQQGLCSVFASSGGLVRVGVGVVLGSAGGEDEAARCCFFISSVACGTRCARASTVLLSVATMVFNS